MSLGSCLDASLGGLEREDKAEQIRFASCLRRLIVITGLDPVIHLLRNSFLQRWMDARIKSGHDGGILWRERQVTLRGRINLKIFKRQSNTNHTFAPPRRDAPESCIYLPPPKRACGMPGARCTRGFVCTLHW
jgi:hypothetical protein